MNALIDGDVLLDFLDGYPAAARGIARYRELRISIISWMELLAGAKTEADEGTRRGFLAHFRLVPLNVGSSGGSHRVAPEISTQASRRDYLGERDYRKLFARVAQHKRLSRKPARRPFPVPALARLRRNRRVHYKSAFGKLRRDR